jgi:thiol-disulfide isomerase/thioredoxin
MAAAATEIAPINEPLAAGTDQEAEEEAAPAGPAVEVKVAETPGQPLAYFRGTTALGDVKLLNWSRKPTGHKAIAIADGQVALRGAAKPEEAQRGPAQVQGDGPLLVSIGADWCTPCSHELADVLELAQQLRPGKPKEGEVRLVMALEGTPDEWPLAEVRDRLFAKHAKHKKLSKPLAKPPWAEFRADIESNWGAAIDRLGVLGGGKVALPVNLLLDRCGHIQAAASGSLDASKKQAFAQQLARLKDAPCYPAPLALPPVPAPRPAAKPSDPKAGARTAPTPPAGQPQLPPTQADPAAVEGSADPASPEKPAAQRPTDDAAAKPVPGPSQAPSVKPPRSATETAKPAAKE